MTFPESKKYVIDFGKYQGKTLDQVANSGLDHEGLRYLDWLVGREFVKREKPVLYLALKTYLGDSNISRSLELVLEET